MRLTEIGDKYGTQKNTHVTHGHTLLALYEPIFERFRRYQGQRIHILEIGVLNGASLKTWREYFINANIFGFDINPESIYKDGTRIEIQIGNQNSLTDLHKVTDRAGGYFDIIIDDGSHVNKYTLKSFEFLWPHLNSGGIYIIEDTICTYDKVDLAWPGMNRNRENMNPNNNRGDIDKFLLNHIKEMDFDKSGIFSIQIYRNVIILQKA